MKRKELLENNLTEDKNVKATVDKAIAADTKFLKREKRNLEDKIEDLEEQLKNRLSSEVAIDKSVIESVYGQLKETQNLLALYTEFEQKFIN